MYTEDENDPYKSSAGFGWMIIFTDLVSLMLTFFVLLFSMSSVHIDKWKSLTDALSQTLNPSSTRSVEATSSKFNIANIFRKKAINLDYLTAVLEKAVTEDPLLSRSQLMRLEDRLIIALPGDLLFPAGRAVLSEGARKALFNLGGVLRNIGNQIGVNGHSDPNPPGKGEYASNWELSLARAIAVANSLRRSGYTEDIIAYGYADSYFSQLPDIPEDQRLAMGRRVDIVVMPTVWSL
ncbi:MAG: flagellar motor protein MotB [Rhodospirillales bacterium]